MSTDNGSPGSWAQWRPQTRSRLIRPLFFLEWSTEWAAYWLGRWGFVRVLEYVGRFGVLVGVISYLRGGEARTAAKHYQAWQVINSAAGLSGGGGREDALRDLMRDHVDLAGVNLKRWTSDGPPDLSGQTLTEAVFDSASLLDVHFKEAILARASFNHATLLGANFQDARLDGANFDHALLLGVDFRNAHMTTISLRNARFFVTANFDSADLRGADLRGASFSGITGFSVRSLLGANVCGVIEDPPGPVSSVIHQKSKGETVCIPSDSAWLVYKQRHAEELGR